MKNEIILYQLEKKTEQLEVLIEQETVWLHRHQLALLFDRDIKTIGKHIANCLNEELKDIPVVAKFATTAKDGKIYQIEHYNLDMIISIGYRVKSHRGVQFRIWANSILKDYLLKGFSINNRMNRIEDNVNNLAKKINEIDLQINANNLPLQGVFFEGQIFDAYELMSKIIKTAKNQIILIDNYVDESVITHLSKKNKNVNVVIITKNISKQLHLDIQKVNAQYGGFKAVQFASSHDRFLIIDNKEVYHLGASLKDLGKKWFAFSKLHHNSIADLLVAVTQLQ
jgi:hypothetical protein